MPKPLILLMVLAVGAVVLCPMIIMLDLEPLPGDFHLTFANTRVNVPVIYSLCASAGLALFLSLMKR
jgi:hypothetical protein